MGCRDCPVCCESAIEALVKSPFRLVHELLTCWNIGLFQKNCPQCGHKLWKHTAQHEFQGGGRRSP